MAAAMLHQFLSSVIGSEPITKEGTVTVLAEPGTLRDPEDQPIHDGEECLAFILFQLIEEEHPIYEEIVSHILPILWKIELKASQQKIPFPEADDLTESIISRLEELKQTEVKLEQGGTISLDYSHVDVVVRLENEYYLQLQTKLRDDPPI